MKNLLLSGLLGLCMLLPATHGASAQQLATGWLPHPEYQAFFDQARYGNLAPTYVEGGLYYGHVRYSAVFGPMPYGFTTWATHHGMTDAGFAQRNQYYLSQGYQLIHHQRLNTEGHLANQGIWYR